MMKLDEVLQARLVERQQQHLYRYRQILDGEQGVLPVVDGRQYLSFCSNDYLGLASHPQLKDAVVRAVAQYGVGSGAAHLVTGHSRAHHALEEELADFTGRKRAVLFSTGYMANLGVVASLLDRHDCIIEDKLNHASLLDAAQLCRAKRLRYTHNDMASLEQRLQSADGRYRLVVSDGVFSMDGDLAELDSMANLCQQYDAWLMVDDAHGLGVLGERGQGSCEYFGLDAEQVPVLVGTLGKALGSFGAFVAGSEALIENVIQQARSYIYTTAPPACIAEATRTSLRLAVQETWRREKLQALIKRFRHGAQQLGLQLMASSTPIQPVLLGESERALKMERYLREQGILVSAIRPPTVPQGTARLRITLSASHEEQQVDQLLQVLEQSKSIQ